MLTIIESIVFRICGGVWKSPDGRILADVLDEHGLVVDDRCEFARIMDYDAQIGYEYRAYPSGKCSLTLYRL